MGGVDAHRRTMDALAQAAARVVATVPSGAVLIDVPLYRNIGDLLIARGTEAALAQHRISLADRFHYPDLGKVRDGTFVLGRRIGALDRLAAGGATLLFQGGGNLGDLWPNHQLLREALIARYPGNRCIILPQSAHFADRAGRDRCLRVFAAHPDLTIHCRDAETLALLGDAARGSLAPDMAHALWRTLPASEGARRGILVQLRRDSERAIAAAPAFDWGDCQLGGEVAIWRAIVTSRRLGALAPVHWAGDALWRRIAARWMARAAVRIGRAERLVTDRLHGLILGALLETPVRYRDNAYGKLGRYAALHMADDPLVLRCATGG